MKKIIPILVIFLFILSGCSAEYNLEISNDKVKENINVEILDSDIPKVDPNDEIEVNDRITPFIKNDQYPIFNDYKTKYKKKVKKVGDLTKITLNYTYSHDEFKRSNTFKTCFENASFVKTKKGYNLKLNGSFYCLYGDTVKINIKTNNYVISNNASKVSGNIYTWEINNDNVQDVDIDLSLSKKTKVVTYGLYVIASGIFLIITVFVYIVYKKYKEKDIVNDL